MSEFAENHSRLQIVLRILGNKRDSKTEWQDARNKVTRTCNIHSLLTGEVGDVIPWSIVPERRRDQEKGVNLALSTFIDMAGSPTVRNYVRKIENNEVTEPPLLAADVDKIKQIIKYYNDLTASNNTKDTTLLELLKHIKFESTGKNNLSNDIIAYFEKVVRNQEETQVAHRMSEFQSVQMCSSHLSQSIPSLRAPMSHLKLTTLTFDELRESIEEICASMEIHGGHHHDHEASTNSTTSSSHSEKAISISPNQLKEVVMSAVKQSRESGRAEYQGNSFRDRGQYTDNRRRSKSKSPSRSSRSPGRNNQRGRSRSNDSQSRGRFSNKRARQLHFSPSTNSTQVAGQFSEEGGSDNDNALVDSVLDSYFHGWAESDN